MCPFVTFDENSLAEDSFRQRAAISPHLTTQYSFTPSIRHVQNSLSKGPALDSHKSHKSQSKRPFRFALAGKESLELCREQSSLASFMQIFRKYTGSKR